jgi:hypothetical protein
MKDALPSSLRFLAALALAVPPLAAPASEGPMPLPYANTIAIPVDHPF